MTFDYDPPIADAEDDLETRVLALTGAVLAHGHVLINLLATGLVGKTAREIALMREIFTYPYAPKTEAQLAQRTQADATIHHYRALVAEHVFDDALRLASHP